MHLAIERASMSSWMPPWVRHQHLARYEWASSYVGGRRVIEVACGTGYGAEILSSRSAAHFHGFDLSPEAVAAARRNCRRESVRFDVAEATQLPASDHSCDVFLSLETIEHLPDDRAFLTEVVRVLRPDGHFICSTPNRTMTNPGTALGQRPFNRHHLREYSQPELQSLFGSRFGQVEFFGQSSYGASYQRSLAQLGRRFPGLAVKAHQARKLLGVPWESSARHWPQPLSPDRTPEILIAVCTAPLRTG